MPEGPSAPLDLDTALDADEDKDEDEDENEGERKFPTDPSFEEWRTTIGQDFKDARLPRNWLGGKVVESVPPPPCAAPRADVAHSPLTALPVELVVQPTFPRA